MHPFLQRGLMVQGEEVSATHEVLMTELNRAQRSKDPQVVAACIANLQSTLPSHFAVEETQGGLFDWIEALLPARSPDIAALLVQHGELFRAVQALDPSSLDAFAQALREHEAKERELLLAAIESHRD